MSLVSCFLFLLACYWVNLSEALNSPADEQLADLNRNQNGPNFERIMGGTPVTPGSRPFMVFTVTRTVSPFVTICTVIDKSHILTAANCVANQARAKPTQVLLAMRVYTLSPLDNSTIIQSVNITNVRVHKQWNATGNYENDIAIIKLQTPINFASVSCLPGKKQCVSVRAVTLPAKNTNKLAYVGKFASIIGWGVSVNSPGADISPTMMQGQVKVLSNSDCSKLSGGGIASPSQICVGLSKQGGCFGDSGGPLLIGSTEIGLLSFVTSPQCTGVSIYTSLPFYINNGWVAANTL